MSKRAGSFVVAVSRFKEEIKKNDKIYDKFVKGFTNLLRAKHKIGGRTWKEKFRYLISYEVLCPEYHYEVSSWTDDINQVDADEVEEKLDDWDCDDFEGGGMLELGEETRRKIQIHISEFKLKTAFQ